MNNINFIDTDYIDEHAAHIRLWVDDAFEDFANSNYFEQLSSNEQNECGFLLSVFFDYCYSYCLVGPGKLSKEVIDEMMLDVLPRKISADKNVFEAFSLVMDKFLRWCEDKKYMTRTEAIRNHIHGLADTMISHSQNPKKWGMAKSMVMGSTFNFNRDDYELNGLNDNSSQVTPYRREQAKIGRNDACPCGSGKKFKKCCLNN